jgi:hypothetical protein
MVRRKGAKDFLVGLLQNNVQSEAQLSVNAWLLSAGGFVLV